ncbi:hypothetical protein Q4566_15825 [Tamlana sp. 2_MG-2023]|uniref:hypothetical protein n=1 Tax=unclassified Tamlana TaxID=2614803 RepID=UPI0026E32614|nr:MULTISPECIES: hypothetical protein [unclassified Tamlana]MDO6761676.1 hypothetical protein [Tamlana sp. 2_MG-2023]MDO6792230.1 hypothetical protein [Tamlana sp. 1_MG-2023]
MSRPIKKNKMYGKHLLNILIILISGYGIYIIIKDKNERWTAESAKILLDKCISESKEMLNPELIKEYCKCSTEKIQLEFTQSEYIEILKMPSKNQTHKLFPVFKNCLTEYRAKK